MTPVNERQQELFNSCLVEPIDTSSMKQITGLLNRELSEFADRFRHKDIPTIQITGEALFTLMRSLINARCLLSSYVDKFDPTHSFLLKAGRDIK